MHYFPGLSEEKVLWEITYTNLQMYLATIPVYEAEEGESEKSKAESMGKTGDERKVSEINKFFKAT